MTIKTFWECERCGRHYEDGPDFDKIVRLAVSKGWGPNTMGRPSNTEEFMLCKYCWDVVERAMRRVPDVEAAK